MSAAVDQRPTSLAEKLAASTRQTQQSSVAQGAQGKARPLQSAGSGNIPARLEEALDVEGDIPINEVEVAGTPLLKILKHSTDPSASNSSSNPSPVDAVGLLLGLDLSGVAEIVDSYPLPGGVQGALNAVGSGADSEKTPFAQNLLRHLREVALLDSPIGIYLTLHSPTLFSTLISETFNPSSTISGSKDPNNQNLAGLAPGSGFMIKGIIELMAAVERMGGNRGSSGKGGSRAVLIVHDAARSSAGDVSIKAYKFSDGFAAALRKQKFDTQSLIEHRLVPSTILQPLKLRTKNPALLNALFAEMSTPSDASPSLQSTKNQVLPSTFLPLQNTTATSLPLSLSNTLSQLTNLSTEQNNLAYQLRQVGREKSKHDQAVQARQQENDLRKKQGLAPLPDVAEPPARKIQDPSRLDLMLCLGAVDNAAKGLAAEAGKGLVKAFASG